MYKENYRLCRRVKSSRTQCGHLTTSCHREGVWRSVIKEIASVVSLHRDLQIASKCKKACHREKQNKKIPSKQYFQKSKYTLN